LTPEREGGVWAVVFAQADGASGVMRLEFHRADRHASFHAELTIPDRGVFVVHDDDVPLPRGQALEVRADSLWAEMVCETPSEHWSFGMEAFGLRFDDAEEARTSEWGERVAVGVDLEWETAGVGSHEGRVVGELLVGSARLPFDGTGTFAHEVD
jgi:hypothetical protein